MISCSLVSLQGFFKGILLNLSIRYRKRAMRNPAKKISHKTTLRQRVLLSVAAVVTVSLLGSVYGLLQITQVNRELDMINRMLVPLAKLLPQLQNDSEILQREMERKLGMEHWRDPLWRPQALPKWIYDLLEAEIRNARVLIEKQPALSSKLEIASEQERWQIWQSDIEKGFVDLKRLSDEIYRSLESQKIKEASELYSQWLSRSQEWDRLIRTAVSDSDRRMRGSFGLVEEEVSGLRTGLQVILVVVVFLSLTLLWFGERALRPLGELTALARQIAERGIRKEDKIQIPELSIRRDDEVSQLNQEFRRMATTLLEREKTVEIQQRRLEEQNQLQRELSEFNQNILNSIDSVIIVTDTEGNVTQCNPGAQEFLRRSSREIVGQSILAFSELTGILQKVITDEQPLASWTKRKEGKRIEPVTFSNRVMGGHFLPLKYEKGSAQGLILVLDDLTEQSQMEDRLKLAEHLATIGRMSAQVAHEVRNPLHSIGLEAELAFEKASEVGDLTLKRSVQSILEAVDRLQHITENYLKLSKPSMSKKEPVNLGNILESVLGIYFPTCEAQHVKIDWHREPGANLEILGDRNLLEQVLGNLLKNALQALDRKSQTFTGAWRPAIRWDMGQAESGRVWIKITDNGPGFDASVRDKIFTPFFTTRAEGTGLGLSFIKKVVEDHGGSIEAVQSLEGGASFLLMFLAHETGQTGYAERNLNHEKNLNS